MTEREAKKILEPLKSVRPDEDWMILCRSRLAFRMEMERKKHIMDKDFSVLGGLFSFLENKSSRLAVGWIYGFSAGLFLLIIGGGATAWAAKHSLPGSAFYPVKIAIERIRMEASLSQENKFKMQAKITDTRLQELQEVVEASESPQKKNEKVEQVVNRLNQQLAQANNRLPQTGSVESEKTIAAAKVVTESAVRVEKALAQAKESLSVEINQSLGKRIAETFETADRAGTKALEIIVGSQDQTRIDRDVLAKLEEKIQIAEERIRVVGEFIGNVSTSSVADKLPIIADSGIGLSTGQDNIADKLPAIRAVLVRDQSEKAQELIEQAKTSLLNNDIIGALESVNLAKTIILGAEKIAEVGMIAPETRDFPLKAADTVQNGATSTLPDQK